MPRNAGIGRTGKKHKKKALFGTHRQPKVEADVVESPAVAEAASSSKNDELEEAAAVMAQATITSESESEEGAEEGSGPAREPASRQKLRGLRAGKRWLLSPSPSPSLTPCMSPSPSPGPTASLCHSARKGAAA